jgi:hypothetical protein
MAELSDLFSVMLAISSDKEKNDRIREILEAQKVHDQAKAEAEATLAESHAALAEGQRLRGEADQLVVAAREHEAQNVDLEQRLRQVREGMTAEQRAFSEVREQVEAEHRRRQAELDAAEPAVAQREERVRQREEDVLEREQMAHQAQTLYDRKLNALHALLAAEDLPAGEISPAEPAAAPRPAPRARR